ncbi:MAG: Gfo/Idh/MocA family oxidoreductase [Planctomycetota bacterium]
MLNDFTIKRRRFLGLAAGIGASASIGRVGWASANDEVRIALIGAGGRGGGLAKAAGKVNGVKIVAVTDPDEKRGGSLAEKLQAKYHKDLRSVLDDPNVDAVIIATCNHWHCLAAMWAIDAGKDVYVEKPLGHSQWEGRQVCAAAERAGAVVQLGTQQRSDPIQMQAREFLHDQKTLGEIQYVIAKRLGVRGTIGKRSSPLSPPGDVDYDLWLGPAQDIPMYRNSFHYDWHWNFNTGSGEMGNWGVHILDDVRNVAYQDSVTTPTRVSAAGGRLVWGDAGTTPNVHAVLFETETFPTFMALSNLPQSTEGKAKSWQVDAGLPVQGSGSGYVVVCEGGYYAGQRGSGKAVDADGKTIRSFKVNGIDTVAMHIENFVNAVRTRDTGSLNAPIENGHHSTGWCNLGNVAVQAAGASSLTMEQLQSTTDVAAWPRLLSDFGSALQGLGSDASQLQIGPTLTHDPATERFVGSNAESGNSFLKREYRKGFEVTEVALQTS